MSASQHQPSDSAPLDEALVRWMAEQLLADRRARLRDGGAAIDERLDLAALFIDLEVDVRLRKSPELEQQRQRKSAMSWLLEPTCVRRWLIVGGPGSGKSTLTQMLAQQLRQLQIGPRLPTLPDKLREQVVPVWQGIRTLAGEKSWSASADLVPVRIALPDLARWLAGFGPSDEVTVWDFLAERRSLSDPGIRIMWILDGLDEVPASAGRDGMIRLIRAMLGDAARQHDGLVVSTREQGYLGEFDDLDELVLRPLQTPVAIGYAERLLRAWGDENVEERIRTMRAEFQGVTELLRTPLHATMATLLVAQLGRLPKSRSELFEHYFDLVMRREFGKPIDHGVQPEDRELLRLLHDRAGIVLHARSQAGGGARASLRRRELRALLSTIHAELGYDDESARERVDTLMRFAEERIVLLLHGIRGEYEFGVRSLQEFFAAQALGDGDPCVEARLRAIAVNPHWSNVLNFAVSRAADEVSPSQRAAVLARTVGLCRWLNDASNDPAAARSFMGTHLAVRMLEETMEHGHPWLHDPLWEIVLSTVTACSGSNVFVPEAAHVRWDPWRSIPTRVGTLAGHWTRAKAQHYRSRVLELASTALSSDEWLVRVGWMLLRGLLLADVPEAISLADRHRPQTVEQARLLAEILSRPAPTWLVGVVGDRPDLFSPFPWLSVGMGKGISLPHGARKSISISLTSSRVIGLYGSVSQQWLLGDPISPAVSDWYRYLVQCLATFSPHSLADFLDAVACSDAWDSITEGFAFGREFPWPLVHCLSSAGSAADLSAISSALRSGSLGSLDDWKAAERRWEQAGGILSMDDALVWLETDGPWNADIGLRGLPFTDPGVLMALREEDRSLILEQLTARLTAGDLPHSKLEFVRRWPRAQLFGPLPLLAAQHLPRDFDGSWLIDHIAILAELKSADAEGWFQLLDQRGREGGLAYFRTANDTQLPAILIERLRSHPEQWGLIDVLGVLVSAEDDLSTLELPAVPDEAPPHIHQYVAFLRVLAGQLDMGELPSLVSRVDQGDMLDSLAWTVAMSPHTHDTTILLAILDHLESRPPVATTSEQLASARDALRTLYLRLARPVFDSADAWHRYDLPAPWLEPIVPHNRPPRLLRIDTVSNIRLFKTTPTVDVEFPLPEGDAGQWLVLIGENGVGKSTLLRALALALAPVSVASKLLDERLSMVRNGGEGLITITLDTGELAISVSREDRDEHVESRSPPSAYRPWVVGYGVRRGNARGEKDRELTPGPYGELQSLFDHPTSLHNATKWLAELYLDVLLERPKSMRHGDTEARPGPSELIWQAVSRALERLSGIREIEVGVGGVVFVRHDGFGRVRLDALSDGYLTTIGWVVDLIARWIKRQYELDEPIGPDLLRQMSGFVLFDEIDLHLHPSWQLRLLDDVRQVFPRMSFVVTTHNPLTLQGARPGEIYVMRAGEGGIELVQRDIRPGHDVDRVLFEQFGIEATFDLETRKLLDEHRQLIARGVGREDPAYVALETAIHARLGGLGETLSRERQPVAPFTPEETAHFLGRRGQRRTSNEES